MTQAVASGWTVDASGRLRRETVHSMKRRCRDWDYRSRCIYMITVELADRRSKALGLLKVADGDGRWVEPAAAKALGLKPEAVRAKVELSELGEIVVACWNEIHRQWPGVSTLGCQVMPDHFHGLIFVEKRQVKTLGNIVGSFKSKSASRIKALVEGTEPHAARYGTAGEFCSSPRAAKLWADGFVDTIIWREGQLKAEIDYLADNPYRLAVKTLFPELFRVVGELAVALPGLGPTATGRFAALGNRFLLMLAPAAWPHQPGEKPMTRFDATAMNRLCQWIAGEDAAEINYHGMKPENIDALARGAAKVDTL